MVASRSAPVACLRRLAVVTLVLVTGSRMPAADPPFVRVADDHRGFVLAPGGRAFEPWGFNYDHDESGRLLEDYWVEEWAKVEADFVEMEELGARVVRIHLQFGKFMEAADRPNERALAQYERLVALAERLGLHLDVTGLGCYHRKDVPAWYDDMTEAKRWKAQQTFWKAVAGRSARSPAIFCYDLMNEPVVPGVGDAREDWLGPAFAGKHFVQFVSRRTGGRARVEVARAWTRAMVRAIREVDTKHLITVGLVPWSLDRPGLTSGFVPGEIIKEIDFVAVHLYPESGKLEEAGETLRGFALGRPLVVEEVFPLKCSAKELGRFMDESRAVVSGWIGFYWGRTPEECRRSGTIGDAITLAWLELFREKRRAQRADGGKRSF